MSIEVGTNLFGDLSSATKVSLTDQSGLAVLAECTGAPATTAGVFQHGCLMIRTDSGTGSQAMYQNVGSTAVPSWSLLDTAGVPLTLPATVTDATSTTGTSLLVTESTLTSGSGIKVVGTTAVLTTGALFAADLSAATTGTGFRAVTTGVYTGAGLLQITAASATTGTLASIAGAGLTTGIGMVITGTAATLTTGRYLSMNDGALEVFGVGANGHLHTTQTTAPTIAVSQQNGITAAAITAGGSDVNGIITTTGTNNNGGTTILQVTFNKTYTTAPKAVMLTARNASGAGPNPPYISAITATTFDITIPASASAGATPSWNYLVVA